MHGEAVVQRSRDVVRCACVDISAAGIALFSSYPARAKDRVRVQAVIGGATLTLDATIVRSRKSNGGHLWALRFKTLNDQTRAHLEAFVAQQLANAARVRQAELFKARMKQAGVPVVQPQVPPMAPAAPTYPGQSAPTVPATQPSASDPAPSSATQPAPSSQTQPTPVQAAPHDAMSGRRRPSGIDLPASDPLDIASFQAGAIPILGGGAGRSPEGNVFEVEPLAAFEPPTQQAEAKATGLPEVVEDSVSLSLPEAPPPMGLEPSGVLPPASPAPFDPHADGELDDSELSAVAPSFGAHASASEEAALLGSSMAFVPAEPDADQTRRLDPEQPPPEESAAAEAEPQAEPVSADEFAANAATFVEPSPDFDDDDDEVTKVSIKAPPRELESSDAATDVAAASTDASADLAAPEEFAAAEPAGAEAFEPVAAFAESEAADSDPAVDPTPPPEVPPVEDIGDVEELSASTGESESGEAELPATLEMVLPAAEAAAAAASEDAQASEASAEPLAAEPTQASADEEKKLSFEPAAAAFDVSGEPFVDERTVARSQEPTPLPEVGADEPAKRPFLGVSEPGLYDDLPAAVGPSPKQSRNFDRYASLDASSDDVEYLGDVQALSSDLTPTGAKQLYTDEALDDAHGEEPTAIRPVTGEGPAYQTGNRPNPAINQASRSGVPTEVESVAPTGPVTVGPEFTPAPQAEYEAGLDRGNHPTDIPSGALAAHEHPTEPGYNVVPQFESAVSGPPAFTEVASIPPAQTGNTMIASLESLGINPAHLNPNTPPPNVPTSFQNAPAVPDTGDAPADFSVVPSFGAPAASGAGFTIVASTDSMLADAAGVAMAPQPSEPAHQAQAPAVPAQPRSPGLEEFATSLYTPSPEALAPQAVARGSDDKTRPLSVELDQAFTTRRPGPGVPTTAPPTAGVSEVELTAMRVKPADPPAEGAGFELNPRAQAEPAPTTGRSLVEDALAKLKAKTEQKRQARGPSEEAATAKLKTIGKPKGKGKGKSGAQPSSSRRKRRAVPNNAEMNAAAMADPQVYELYKQALTDIDSSR